MIKVSEKKSQIQITLFIYILTAGKKNTKFLALFNKVSMSEVMPWIKRLC